MSHSASTFPARFAELVYLLANEPDALLEQERVLGEAVEAIATGDASLTTTQLNVDLLDEGQSADGVRLHELVMRMSAHSAHQIDVLSKAPSGEILGVARILASEARAKDDGAAFDDKLLKLQPTSIEVHLGRNGFVRIGNMTPASAPRVASNTPRVATPFRAMPAYKTPPSVQRMPTPGANRAVRSTPIRNASITPASGALTLGASLTTDAEQLRPTPGVQSIRDESPRIIEGAIKTKALAQLSDDDLIAQLEVGVSQQNAMRMLDELLAVAEMRAAEHRWDVVARMFIVMVRGEAAAENNPELRRSYTIGIRRLTKPTLIRGIAGLLPRRRELRDDLQDALLRLGPDGAEALIDLLTTADILTDRRAYLAALAKCRDAVPTLIHLLGDSRWFVVRNAADLLGEMRAVEGEGALLDAVSHREERVRRSVATALARLATPRAIQSVQQMLNDTVPEVRIHAAQGIGSMKWPRAAGVLARALDSEADPEVQAVILASLGRQATEEAVARLVKAAEPEGRLFKRKPTALRVAAVQALAEANTTSALAALRRFIEDRERDVRDIVGRALKPKQES